MKIGILTFHFSDNYGTLLQAFCLQEYIRSLGHQVEFINYHPYYVEQGFSLSDFFKPTLSKKYLKKLYLFSSYHYQRLFPFSDHTSSLSLFRENSLVISPSLSRNYLQLQSHLDYELIVIGSDQVWNPSDQYGPDPVYFGHPFSSHIPTISFSASFGSISRIESHIDVILPWIRSLSKCSVREDNAYAFLHANKLECELMPDPTLLVDELKRYMVSPSDVDLSSAIFAYAIRSKDGVSDIVSLLASQLGLRVISAFTPWRRWNRIGKEIDLDPFTFLGAISDSKLVVSNSFHGIVCSVLLQKNFIAVSLPGSKAKLSSRIVSFLTALGIEDRLLSPSQSSLALKLATKQIDWSSVNERISSLQMKGRSFLALTLNNSTL